MTEKEFIVWLKGYFEIQNPESIPAKETQIIRDHLETFFKKVTPDRSLSVMPTPIPPDNIVITPSMHGALCTCVSCNRNRMIIKQLPLTKATCPICGKENCTTLDHITC